MILKLHGRVERTPAREWESFVVTEDDYIDYLAQTEIAAAVPVALAAKLRRSHFLFLGYTMADWNLRVILHRLWGDQPAQLPLVGRAAGAEARSSGSSGAGATSTCSSCRSRSTSGFSAATWLRDRPARAHERRCGLASDAVQGARAVRGHRARRAASSSAATASGR